MARGLNKILIIGNITADPEIKTAASGTNIANFTVATNESRKNQSGEYEDYAEFHRCVAFGRTADVLNDYTHKGSKVYIEGRIQTRSWEGDDGVKKYSTEIVTNQLLLLDSKSDGQAKPAYSAPAQPAAEPVQDDLPF